ASGKLASIQREGKLVVYTDPNFYPFEFPGTEGIEGVDVEIAKAIAAELGVTPEFLESKFDAIITSLKDGKGDIAISGITITEDRKRNVDFSEPYINSIQYLILPAGSARAAIEDLAGKKIGVAKGYTGSLLINDEINKEDGALFGKGSSFTEYPSAMEAVLDLLNGKNDAVIMDEYVAKSIVSTRAELIAIELTYADGVVAAEEYGVAVPKGNANLLEKINITIRRLKEAGLVKEWVLQYSAVG
ncbi:MAG: transporter substrate-binding domain-containing protein, partial [Clostridiales bacterium]|nr:transporter substrate-binding domain-containing protein [Clostridiales bacterium]